MHNSATKQHKVIDLSHDKSIHQVMGLMTTSLPAIRGIDCRRQYTIGGTYFDSLYANYSIDPNCAMLPPK